MKTISVLALVASLLTVAPALAVAPGSDGLCGPDAPDAYKRPGGYCETLDQGSLSLPTKGGVASSELLLPEEIDDGGYTPCPPEAVVC